MFATSLLHSSMQMLRHITNRRDESTLLKLLATHQILWALVTCKWVRWIFIQYFTTPWLRLSTMTIPSAPWTKFMLSRYILSHKHNKVKIWITTNRDSTTPSAFGLHVMRGYSYAASGGVHSIIRWSLSPCESRGNQLSEVLPPRR